MELSKTQPDSKTPCWVRVRLRVLLSNYQRLVSGPVGEWRHWTWIRPTPDSPSNARVRLEGGKESINGNLR